MITCRQLVASVLLASPPPRQGIWARTVSHLEDVDSVFVARVSPNTLLEEPPGFLKVAQLMLHDTPCLQHTTMFGNSDVNKIMPSGSRALTLTCPWVHPAVPCGLHARATAHAHTPTLPTGCDQDNFSPQAHLEIFVVAMTLLESHPKITLKPNRSSPATSTGDVGRLLGLVGRVTGQHHSGATPFPQWPVPGKALGLLD